MKKLKYWIALKLVSLAEWLCPNDTVSAARDRIIYGMFIERIDPKKMFNS